MGRGARTGRAVVATLLVVLLTAAALLPFLLDPERWIADVEALLRRLGPLGPLAYAGLVVLWMLTTIPAVPLFVVGGLVFGPVEAILLSFAGVVAGVTATFFLGRAGGRRLLERLRARHESVARIEAKVREQGFLVVALVRLAPVFPLNLLNYGLGATRMRFRTYFVASLVVSLPGVALYAGAGAVVRRFLGGGGRPGWAIAGLALLGAALAAATVAVRRRMGNGAARAGSEEEEEAGATPRDAAPVSRRS